MHRILHIGSLVLLAVGVSFGSDQKAPKEPPPPPPPAAKPAPAKGGVPKAAMPKGGQKMLNPTNAATRLFRASPEERERALERAGLKQRENAMKLLAWFDDLPKEQQAMQLRRLDRYEKLTPEKKLDVIQQFSALKELPAQRQNFVGRWLWQLQNMTDKEREVLLNRPAFRDRFSPEELKIIVGLADAWMGPPGN